MKIYTKRGDQGKTSIIGASDIPKDDQRIEAYGTVDELQAVIGLLTSKEVHNKEFLQRIQSTLFEIGAELASTKPKEVLNPKDIQILENEIDQMETELEPLKSFILQGGSEISAIAHFARVVCRRAERRVVSFAQNSTVDSKILQYLNRLSDYFFVLARYYNKQAGIPDVKWIPRNTKK